MVRRGQNVYERELKEILCGEREAIHAMSRTMPPGEREGYECATRIPFVVVRAAGSLGIDLVALRGDFAFPIEVKASITKRMRLSRNRRLAEQRDELVAICTPARVLPLYALRLKGVRSADPWRVFALPMDNLSPRLKTIMKRIPTFSITPAGNFLLDWDSGLKLSDFLRYLEYMSERGHP